MIGPLPCRCFPPPVPSACTGPVLCDPSFFIWRVCLNNPPPPPYCQPPPPLWAVGQLRYEAHRGKTIAIVLFCIRVCGRCFVVLPVAVCVRWTCLYCQQTVRVRGLNRRHSIVHSEAEGGGGQTCGEARHGGFAYRHPPPLFSVVGGFTPFGYGVFATWLYRVALVPVAMAQIPTEMAQFSTEYMCVGMTIKSGEVH